MIYAQTISIPATSVVEVFTEVGIDPLRCEVLTQVPGSRVDSPALYLAQDATGGVIGPAMDSEGTYYSPDALWASTFRFFTDKDPVYLYNASDSALTVAVALTSVP
jgi:hypothetical protein